MRKLAELRLSFFAGQPHCCRYIPDSSLKNMLYTLVAVLVVLWLLGFIAHVGGGLIHLLLVVAVIVLIINFITGRRGL